MPIWQRLLITLAIMLLASYLVGLLWHWLFNSDIPSYLSGAGGQSIGATRTSPRRGRHGITHRPSASDGSSVGTPTSERR